MNSIRSSTPVIRKALLVAAMYLGGMVVLRMFTPEYISREMSSRIFGVVLGGLLVFYANAVPKALTSLEAMRCDPAREQAVRRFTGWTLTLTGLAYMSIWIVATVDVAEVLSTSVLALGVVIVIIRVIASRR